LSDRPDRIRLRPEYRDHVRSYDFVTDRTHDGRPLKILVVIDEFSRKSKSAWYGGYDVSLSGLPGRSSRPGIAFRALVRLRSELRRDRLRSKLRKGRDGLPGRSLKRSFERSLVGRLGLDLGERRRPVVVAEKVGWKEVGLRRPAGSAQGPHALHAVNPNEC